MGLFDYLLIICSYVYNRLFENFKIVDQKFVMTTKIISRNSPKKQSPLTYSLSEIRKKSV